MNEATPHRSRAGVQVLVTAPNREIDIVPMQLQTDVSSGMGQVKTDLDSLIVCGLSDGFDWKKPVRCSTERLATKPGPIPNRAVQ